MFQLGSKKPRLKIAVAVVAFNEEKILPFFLQHYRQFCETIIVYDNYSSDKTAEIARAGADIVRQYDSGGTLRDDIHIQIKDSVWKEKDLRRHDWFITVDADEFIYADDIFSLLEEHKRRGTRVLRPAGYSMFHEDRILPDEPLTHQIPTGIEYKLLCKPVVFRPNAIRATNFSVGCHDATPTDFWRRPVTMVDEPRLKLLHYKYIWGFDFLSGVYQQRNDRLSDLNKQNAWGTHYHLEKLQKEYEQHRKESKVVV